jgi:hypothetical protein
MKTTIEKITPRLAQEYLQKVDPAHQRKLIVSRAQAFAREMTAGHWFLNHQGIAFDEHGRLIDGQHRLKAIELSGLTIQMLVTRGITSEMVNGVKLYAIDTIDVGYKRQTGEQLTLRHGIENGNRVASATRTILHWATGLSKNTTPVALEILGMYPSIKKLASCSKSCRILNGQLIGCFAIATKSFPELSEQFVDPFISGANLQKNSPVLLLRNILLNNKISDGGKARLSAHMSWTLNALRWAALKEEVKQLKAGNAGWLFFADHQKGNVRKIRAAAGLTETTEQEEK